MSLADRWATALADIEREVDAFEDAARTGEDVEVAPWSAPAELGPLPTELRQRAVRLLERVTAAEQRAATRLGELVELRGDVDRRRDAGSAYARAGAG